MFRYILVLAFSIGLGNSYVLVQVVKNDQNQSDVKAYVHKVMPSADARRNPGDDERVRRFEVMQRADEEENRNQRRRQTVMWMNQAFDALKRMANGPEFRTSETMSFVDKALDFAKSYVNGPEFRSSKTMKYIEKVIDIVKDVASGPETPDYRSGKRSPNMKTEIVHFNGKQPSLVFELRPNFFIDFVKKILSTQLVEKYMDDMGISNPNRNYNPDQNRNYNHNPNRYYKKKYPSKYSKYT